MFCVETITIIGLLAGLCTTFGLFPQIIKSWKTKRTKDVSLLMYIILIIGILLWLGYGLFLKDLPIVLWNAVALVLAAIILILKIKYG